MQGLRSSKNGGQCLDCRTDNVIIRLLSGQRAASGLSVEAQHPGARILGLEALFHHPVPDFASSAVFGNFFKEIIMGVKKEREARSKIVYVQSHLEGGLYVLDSVSQGKSQFLQGGRSRFANMVAANGDRVPARNLLGGKLKNVGNETQGRPWWKNPFLLSDVFFQNVILQGSGNLL